MAVPEYFIQQSTRNVSTAQHSIMADNHTVNNTLESAAPFTIPSWALMFVVLFYIVIIVLSIGGNIIICNIILKCKGMRTVTNFFIMNLSGADIFMSVMCIPFTFTADVILGFWPFGAVMCPLVLYAQTVAVFSSAFTLVAISVDRYLAIIYPLRERITTKQALVIICGIWALGLLVPLPTAIISRQDSIENGTVYICVETWPANYRIAYSIYIMILQYFLPLFVLLFTYTRIAIFIWVKATPGEAESGRDQRIAASKRKMVKMMITVVVIYALCWLPLHSITLAGDFSNVYDYHYIQVVWIACHWLAMSNCCYNPMVYCWRSSKYRQGFKHVLQMLPCIRRAATAAGYRQETGRFTNTSTAGRSTVSWAPSRELQTTCTYTPSPQQRRWVEASTTEQLLPSQPPAIATTNGLIDQNV